MAQKLKNTKTSDRRQLAAALKVAEEQLKKAHEELEYKVDVRTQALVAIEKKLRLSNAVLKLFGKVSSRSEYLQKVVKLMQSLSHCRCAGIRVMDDEGNIPYESYVGFSKGFWEQENWLCAATDKCACIRVITQRPEPEDMPAMTDGGSFLLDNSVKFEAGLTKEGRSKFRGTCIKNRFLSIAVIPVHYKAKVIAAIHLADEQENKLPLELVESIEWVTDLIGEGVYKFTLIEKVQKSNELLERAKRLSDVGSLAATVAHELRNPLGVIRTAAFNIRRKAKNPLLEGHIANIEKKIIESDQIINNLLFYSRLRVPHIEKARIFDILNNSLAAVKDKCSKASIRIVKRINSIRDDFFDVDPLQMGELFDNVLGNACDAFKDKGRIEVRGDKDDAGNIIVRVRDYGIGMDEEQLKRMFEPFYTTKAKGTGLGLTVCKQIVDLHNGSLDIQSEKSKGTTVTIKLPVIRKNAPAIIDS